ncbi:MAG: hypothetical protein OXN27_22490 [Candidatus Poribacteria bacterium]|nr:hypothetical protein [Candidatus Poribacteria bacterium]
MLITQDDIQPIGDEATLLHFLEEKLNLPIPESLPLEDITTKFAKFALGLSAVVANQVLDCQELSVSPGESSGIILIRFNSESGYAEALRAVAEGLDKLGRSPINLRFICMNEYFQPFAFANFNDSESKDWQTAVLNIRVWTQENTHIHTSWEHELPANFFGKESTDEFEDKIEINEFNVIASLSSPDLSAKLEDIGTQLGMLEHIHSGITTAYDRALLIDEGTRKHLLAEDPNSHELIKRSPRISRKWICEPKYLIGILSSHIKQWPWSHISSESAAERIFEETYPAIHAHLSRYTNGLKKRTENVQGKFYWEMSNKRLYSTPERPKIIYPLSPTSMQAVYDPLDGIPTSSFHIIPTTDLSLLSILNSNCFQWYAKTNYSKPIGNQLILKKGNMQNAPIAPRTEEQKVELSSLVQQILDTPNSPNVPNLEEEINMLV